MTAPHLNDARLPISGVIEIGGRAMKRLTKHFGNGGEPVKVLIEATIDDLYDITHGIGQAFNITITAVKTDEAE